LTEERVVLVAPAAGEAEALCRQVAAEGHQPCPCPAVAEALSELERTAAVALIVAAEALDQAAVKALSDWLGAQGPWSDLPVLLLCGPAAAEALRKDLQAFVEEANVTVVPRPAAAPTLASWLRSAVRVRRREQKARRLVADLERSVRFGETLVSVLGHDLRTPLAAARLSAEMILRTSRDERALRPAGRVLSSTHRMQRLIDQLLDYTRVREGQGLPLNLRATDLGELARAVCAEVENAEPGSQLEFQEQGDPEGDCDPDRLAQLLANLLTNAVKHGAAGEPVTIRLDGRGSGRVSLSVHNAGAISPAVLPVIFEPFRGIAEATGRDGLRHARPGGGLGLGLYIAREIARAHGGDIVVMTSSREGTTFTVTLPRHPPLRSPG